MVNFERLGKLDPSKRRNWFSFRNISRKELTFQFTYLSISTVIYLLLGLNSSVKDTLSKEYLILRGIGVSLFLIFFFIIIIMQLLKDINYFKIFSYVNIFIGIVTIILAWYVSSFNYFEPLLIGFNLGKIILPGYFIIRNLFELKNRKQ